MIPFAILLLAGLSGEAAVATQAVFTPERPPAAGSPTYVNARVVAIDPQGRTITVRRGGVGKDETFPVEAQALQRIGVLAPGQQVMLTLRAGGAGQPEVVTQIERSVRGARPRSTTRRGRAGTPSAGAVSAAPGPAPSPTSTPSPSPSPSRLPTDTVGPLRDPRVAPNTDPRQNPLRDPRVVPGLTEPVPTPTPTATPPPRGRASPSELSSSARSSPACGAAPGSAGKGCAR